MKRVVFCVIFLISYYVPSVSASFLTYLAQENVRLQQKSRNMKEHQALVIMPQVLQQVAEVELLLKLDPSFCRSPVGQHLQCLFAFDGPFEDTSDEVRKFLIIRFLDHLEKMLKHQDADGILASQKALMVAFSRGVKTIIGDHSMLNYWVGGVVVSSALILLGCLRCSKY